MEQRLNLQRQLADEKEKLHLLRLEVRELEERVARKERLRLNSLGTRTDVVSWLNNELLCKVVRGKYADMCSPYKNV